MNPLRLLYNFVNPVSIPFLINVPEKTFVKSLYCTFQRYIGAKVVFFIEQNRCPRSRLASKRNLWYPPPTPCNLRVCNLGVWPQMYNVKQ